ncbi:MAG: hypothetical protein NWF00_09980 [Candidatus Bathyarchaeota archaeon]|nr:hypothetical protein [Candidatus Bathyarchaeota archaeon]
MELPVHFQTFLANIEPTNDQKNEVSTGYAALRSRLQEGEYADYFQGSFLSGSYGRGTAIQSTKIADVIVAANYSRSLWEPHLSLFQLKRILSKGYKTVTAQNSSIRIPLSLVELDITPAITEERTFLRIPDHTAHNWVHSNAHRHIQLSVAMDTQKNGLYRPLVRVLKWWRDHKMADVWKPKSFLLECIVYDYAANSMLTSVPKAIEGFLWYTHNKYKQFRENHESSPFIREIGAPDVNVAKNWAYIDFCSFMDEVHRSWILSHQAVEAESKVMSIDRWRQLLGDAFPADAELKN